MSLSPDSISRQCRDRVERQMGRIQKYQKLFMEYKGSAAGEGGGIRGSWGDGRPALQDLSEMHTDLSTRPGAPNWIRPVVDDRVATTSVLPVITFDQAGDQPEDVERSTLCSRAVRGQYELSQMSLQFVNAQFFSTLYGETAYTLDPLRPRDAKALSDPFAVPGVYINVQNPSHCYPRFGMGRERHRLQDMFLFYPDLSPEEVESYYPEQMGNLPISERYDLIVFYGDDFKATYVSVGDRAIEVFRDDHHYGFVPAEWGWNKVDGSNWGVSEVEETTELHRTSQKLFHLAMDGAIMATFPPIHVHQPEHVGRLRYGPLAIIETVEDGRVEPLASYVNTQVPVQLLDVSKGNLLTQTGTSPIRQNMAIEHANTSGRAIDNAQAPGQARVNMSNTLQGTSLEWLNAKIARILYQDPSFKNTEMTVYGVGDKSNKGPVTFRGSDLQGLWRNHVAWTGDQNKHEQEVMYLQLYKENLVSGRKVLEVMGEDDPERLIKEAQAEKMSMQQGMPQQGPPGSPTQAAQEGVALGAGAMPGGPSLPGPGGAQPPPPTAGGGPPPSAPPSSPMPPFPPMASSPAGPPAGASPVPDINMEVQQASAALKLHGEIVGATTTPRGILLFVTSHKDIAILKTALKPLAEQLFGPGAKVETQVTEATA